MTKAREGASVATTEGARAVATTRAAVWARRLQRRRASGVGEDGSDDEGVDDEGGVGEK